MNDNLKLLTDTVALFPVTAFYCNSYSEFDVKLQGKYSPVTVVRAKDLGFVNNINTVNGYVEMLKDNITITLTD